LIVEALLIVDCGLVIGAAARLLPITNRPSTINNQSHINDPECKD
jgi:hypothetical protein